MKHPEIFHAKTLRGLEELLAGELTELGAQQVVPVNRGVNFSGGRSLMYKVNVASRLSLRVLLPVLQFQADSEETLYRKVKQHDWSVYLDNKMTFAIDSVTFSPVFRNSHYVSLKVKDAIADQFRERTHLRPSVNKEHPDVLINVHVSGTRFTLSLDSSGESLHKRGYRVESVEAPLNEVLAAGMIRMTGWKGDQPFIDPMCGSGTLAIEAAMMAANIPPGLFRKSYGFETWKDFEPALMEQVLNSLPGEKPVRVPVIARDIDPAAVRATRRNIRKADLGQLIQAEQQDFLISEGSGEPSLILINPPYGERMKQSDLDEFYSSIGSTLKHQYPGCSAWILSSSLQAMKRIGLRPSARKTLFNGSLECSFSNYKTFKGDWKRFKSGTDEGSGINQ